MGVDLSSNLTVYSNEGQSEQEIKKQIMAFLKWKKIFCWVNSSVGIYDAAKGIYRKKNSLFEMKGTADILGIYKGRFLAVEVKSAKGVLSDYQKIFLENVRYEGGVAFVARSVRDVELELGRW